jgi:uncharacterized protein (TIGR02001 family)
MLDLPPPVPAIEFNLATTGMSKGLAQTEGPQALVRGELAFGHLYVGAYAKNVTSTSAEGEAAGVIGVRTSLAGFDVGASAAWKRAIDPAPGSDANAVELNTFASRRLGSVTPRLAVTWSPDDVGSTGRTVFVEAGASYKLEKSLSVSAAVGRRERTGGLDYTAWNMGGAWTPVKPVTLDLRYHNTNRGGDYPYKARFVGSARLKF